MNLDLITNLYQKTDDGLEIILDCYPEIRGNERKHFKLRDEKVASARLYPPSTRTEYHCWSVYDFGEGKYYSPIDIYIHYRLYNPDTDFYKALLELCDQYNIERFINISQCKPIYNKQYIGEGLDRAPIVTIKRENYNFTSEELNVWGSNVSSEDLKALHWFPVSTLEFYDIESGYLTQYTATPEYPIFTQVIQTPTGIFEKIYKPRDKEQFRFLYINKKDFNDYIFGLDLIEAKGEKVSEIIICSGGSDAVNLHSFGYNPVYFNSESSTIRKSAIDKLYKYTDKVIVLLDLDKTGQKRTKEIVLQYPQLYYITLPDMPLKNQKNGICKDFKDYTFIYPNKTMVDRLIRNAVSIQWWNRNEKKITISPTRYINFLELLGYRTRMISGNNTKSQGPQYVKVNGMIIEDVNFDAIKRETRIWATKWNLGDDIMDAFRRCKDLPNKNDSSMLSEINPDLRHYGKNSRYFYGRDKGVKITENKTDCFDYDNVVDNHYVLKSDIQDITIGNYEFKKTISIEKQDDGNYYIDYKNDKSKLIELIEKTSIKNWEKETLDKDEIQDCMNYMANKLCAMALPLIGEKSETDTAMIIYVDADSYLYFDDNSNNGRSGKSTLAKYSKELGLAEFSKMDADSKRNRDNRFSFQNIKETTDVALIDDLKNNIDLSYLYDRISGDFNVEEKHKPMKSIPFKDAPTIVATTNSMPRVEDSSTKDRILFVPVFTFFHVNAPNNRFTDTRRISDYFGFRLFEEGHTNAMRLDDLNLLFQAIQYIMSLSAGSKKIDPPMEEINQRMRVSKIGTKFNNWIENLLETDFKNSTIYINKLKDLYFREFNKNIDTETLHKEIITFAKIHKNEYTLNPGEKDPENVRKTMGGRKQYTFLFVKNKNIKSA